MGRQPDVPGRHEDGVLPVHSKRSSSKRPPTSVRDAAGRTPSSSPSTSSKADVSLRRVATTTASELFLRGSYAAYANPPLACLSVASLDDLRLRGFKRVRVSSIHRGLLLMNGGDAARCEALRRPCPSETSSAVPRYGPQPNRDAYVQRAARMPRFPVHVAGWCHRPASLCIRASQAERNEDGHIQHSQTHVTIGV